MVRNDSSAMGKGSEMGKAIRRSDIDPSIKKNEARISKLDIKVWN